MGKSETIREGAIEAMAGGVLDALVIGGGIVGTGVARDAAMRGLSVGLLEQQDFAFGASSRSSRLLHGGLRYLALGRVGLVREASREKTILGRIAPHLVQPLEFVFPAYRGAWPPLWQLAIGVRVYDALCLGRNFGPSRSWNARSTLERVAGLRPEGLAGSASYHDALTNDARLAIDTLRSAAAHGALACNYARVKRAERRADGWTIEARDVRRNRDFQVRSRCVVNATGAWAGQFPQSRLKLRPTKGAHVVVDRERLPVAEAVVMTEGPRILFAIPWGNRAILGTTDTDYSGSLEEVCADAEDVGKILRTVNHYFPGADLGARDVRSSWAGLRPLIWDGRRKPSDTSRAHRIVFDRLGWIDVGGGKLTTYRLMAEQTVDRIVGCLGRRAPRCRTAEEPLIAAEEAAGVSGVHPPAVTQDAVRHYCEREWALHLEDVMVRRSGWHYGADDLGTTGRQVARWMAEVLGWDAATEGAEMGRYRELIGRIGV